MQEHTTPEPPILRIERGGPTDVEIAAVTAATFALSSARGAEPEQPRKRSAWADPRHALRQSASNRLFAVGDDAWWMSGLPR